MALLKINMRWNNEMTDLGLGRVLSSGVNQQFLYVSILDNWDKNSSSWNHTIKQEDLWSAHEPSVLWNSKFSVGAIENFHLAVVRIENSSTFQMLWDGGTPFPKAQVNVLLNETYALSPFIPMSKETKCGKSYSWTLYIYFIHHVAFSLGLRTSFFPCAYSLLTIVIDFVSLSTWKQINYFKIFI